MPRAGHVLERKTDYVTKFTNVARSSKNALVCEADMVTSVQFQQIRMKLRGTGTLLMGKNSLMRKALRNLIPERRSLEKLLPLVRGNIGLVFTDGDLSSVRDLLEKTRVASAARVGVTSPCDVIVPKGITSLQATETTFMQGLGFSTRVAKGALEIIDDMHLLKVGQRVGANEVTVLAKLGIKPFMYGLQVTKCFEDGAVFDPEVLDVTSADLAKAVSDASQMIAAVGLEINYPTVASVPHDFNAQLRELIAIALEADYDMPQVRKIKEILANPSAFAAAAPAAAAPAAAAPAAAAAPEKEEEEEGDFGLGLFD